MSADKQIREQFGAVGVRGWLHAAPITKVPTGEEVVVDADDPVVMASVYKLPLLVAFCRAVDQGIIDPTEPVELAPADRTPGPTGFAAMSDVVVATWRDLARSMITVSDNAAGDALLDHLGLDHVRVTLQTLGLAQTHIRRGTRDIYRILTDDTGAGTVYEAMELLQNNDHAIRSRAFDPLLASSTTGRDMTSLLAAIWTDKAATPQQCEFMREVLVQQIWPHRLSAGFPYAGVQIAGKTGTLGPLRHEVGVVRHRNETPIAVAVFTKAARADQNQPRVDAAIGSAARTAVNSLR